MKRKIAAIMAADIAGFSALVAEDEESTLDRLVAQRGVFDEVVTRYGGRIFNTAGDAVLAEFQSAVQAVRCAVDIQDRIRAHNRSYPAARQMTYRIGISIGDVVEANGDLLGDGVNIAARLEGLADSGGICVSNWVYEQVAGKVALKFTDIGKQAVKNIPNPVHAYVAVPLPHVHGAPTQPDAARTAAAQPARARESRATAPVAARGTSLGKRLFGGAVQPASPPPVTPAAPEPMPQAPVAEAAAPVSVEPRPAAALPVAVARDVASPETAPASAPVAALAEPSSRRLPPGFDEEPATPATSVPAAEPAPAPEVPTRPTAPVAAPAEPGPPIGLMPDVRILAAGAVALIVAVVLGIWLLRETAPDSTAGGPHRVPLPTPAPRATVAPAPVTVPAPPASPATTTAAPAPAPSVVRPSVPEASVPKPAPVESTPPRAVEPARPPETPASKPEPAASEPARAAVAPPPEPARTTPAPKPVESQPAPAAVPPSILAPAPSKAAAEQPVPPARAETARSGSEPAAGADKRKRGALCKELLERAQLGELTADDRAYLRSECR